MGLKKIVDKIKQEVKVLQGEESKDKLYSNRNTYPNLASARQAFEEAKQKLFDVNRWSDLPGINSKFELHDSYGNKLNEPLKSTGYFIRIELPGPTPENWVQVSDVRQEENLAEFTVHPSEKPEPSAGDEEVVEHFFTKEASSTFRVTLEGSTLTAYEIGRNEAINNQGEEAGDRAVANTLIAEGGWAGIQKLQWDKVTAYLVHLEETEES